LGCCALLIKFSPFCCPKSSPQELAGARARNSELEEALAARDDAINLLTEQLEAGGGGGGGRDGGSADLGARGGAHGGEGSSLYGSASLGAYAYGVGDGGGGAAGDGYDDGGDSVRSYPLSEINDEGEEGGGGWVDGVGNGRGIFSLPRASLEHGSPPLAHDSPQRASPAVAAIAAEIAEEGGGGRGSPARGGGSTGGAPAVAAVAAAVAAAADAAVEEPAPHGSPAFPVRNLFAAAAHGGGGGGADGGSPLVAAVAAEVAEAAAEAQAAGEATTPCSITASELAGGLISISSADYGSFATTPGDGDADAEGSPARGGGGRRRARASVSPARKRLFTAANPLFVNDEALLDSTDSDGGGDVDVALALPPAPAVAAVAAMTAAAATQDASRDADARSPTVDRGGAKEAGTGSPARFFGGPAADQRAPRAWKPAAPPAADASRKWRR